MSTVKANDLMKVDGSIPTVKGQQLIPTAWVSFNGTGGTAIRGSENVSSLTDNAQGKFTINFSTAMANINYSFSGSMSSAPDDTARGPSGICPNKDSVRTTTALPVVTLLGSRSDTSGVLYDAIYNDVLVMGGQA